MVTFQKMISCLQEFWADKDCLILQPYDIQVGAGTFHPATTLYTLSNNPWKVAYVQPSRRPGDGRYGQNPNRLQHYFQFQVVLRPIPNHIQAWYLQSLEAIGLNLKEQDIRFVEDNWESPTLGAWGLGWEVWCNGMEVSQFTYFQQLCGIDCQPAAVELTYGLERLAMVVQQCHCIFDLKFNNQVTYGALYYKVEQQYSKYNFEHINQQLVQKQIEELKEECQYLLSEKLALPAYDCCLKLSHLFNLLDARGYISTSERPVMIAKIRELVRKCAKNWLENI